MQKKLIMSIISITALLLIAGCPATEKIAGAKQTVYTSGLNVQFSYNDSLTTTDYLTIYNYSGENIVSFKAYGTTLPPSTSTQPDWSTVAELIPTTPILVNSSQTFHITTDNTGNIPNISSGSTIWVRLEGLSGKFVIAAFTWTFNTDKWGIYVKSN